MKTFFMLLSLWVFGALLGGLIWYRIRAAGRRQYYHELRQGIRFDSLGAIEREADRTIVNLYAGESLKRGDAVKLKDGRAFKIGDPHA